MTLEKLSKRSASLRLTLLALIFMLKMFSFRIFSLPKNTALLYKKRKKNIVHIIAKTNSRIVVITYCNYILTKKLIVCTIVIEADCLRSETNIL